MSNPLVLRPYQTEAVEYVANNGSLIIGDDCGLGKTVTGIECAKRFLKYKTDKCLVIAPKSVLPQWVDAILKQAPEYEVIVPRRLAMHWEFVSGFVIITWDDLISKTTNVHEILWDFIIADEAHRAKNHTTARAKALHRLHRATVVALTATEMERSTDLWSLLHWVAPDKFPTYWGFVLKHFKTRKGYFGGQEISGIKDLERYAAAVGPYYLRRTKQEVAPDLPPLIEVTVPVEMLPMQQRLYDAMTTAPDIVFEYENVRMLILNTLSLLTKLQQVTSLPSMLGVNIGSAKIEWCKEFTEDHPTLKIVFLTRFVDTAEILGSIYECGVFDGDATAFKTGGKQYLVGTIDSLGEGVDLPMADAAVFVDLHWSATKMTQAISRIHRMNITDPKTVYFLQASTVDKMIMRAIKRKWNERELVRFAIKMFRGGLV